jgi:hypothetical protein
MKAGAVIKTVVFMVIMVTAKTEITAKEKVMEGNGRK